MDIMLRKWASFGFDVFRSSFTRKYKRLWFIFLVVFNVYFLTMLSMVSIEIREFDTKSSFKLPAINTSVTDTWMKKTGNQTPNKVKQTVMINGKTICEEKYLPKEICRIQIITPSCKKTTKDIAYYSHKTLGMVPKVIQASPTSRSVFGKLLLNEKIAMQWKHPMKSYVLGGAVNFSTCKFHRYGIFYQEKNISIWKNIADYHRNISEDFWTIWMGEGPISTSSVLFHSVYMPYDTLITRFRGGFAAIMSPLYLGALEYVFSGTGVAANIEKTIHTGTPFKFDINRDRTEKEVVQNHPDVQSGSWSPGECVAQRRLAVIIPFRQRWGHLRIFLDAIFTFLKLQRSAFDIYLLHQAEPELFNRAALMNIGYLESSKNGPYDCYIFHDVDLIPSDLSNIYQCGDQPRHLVVARSKDKYREPLGRYWNYRYFGGAIAMTSEQIQKINGFPNKIFGWGGEDDEISKRIELVGMNITEYPIEIATYKELPHLPDRGNPHMNDSLKFFKLYAEFMMYKDGLNTAKYTILSTRKDSLYTQIHVKINGPATPKEQKSHTKELRRELYRKKARQSQNLKTSTPRRTT